MNGFIKPSNYTITFNKDIQNNYSKSIGLKAIWFIRV